MAFPAHASRRLAAVVLLAGAAALGGCARKAPPPADPAPARVVVAPAVVDPAVLDYEDFTGRTEAVQVIEVRAEVTGRLEAIGFTDGEFVTAGRELFRIEDQLFRARLNSAAANVDVAKARVGVAEARVEQYKDDVARLEKQGTSGAASDLNKSRADLAAAVADTKAAKAAVEVAVANRDEADTTWQRTRVVAKESGRISKRLRDVGNTIKENDTLLTTLVVVDPIYIGFDIDEQTLLRLRDLIREGRVLAGGRNRSVRVALANQDETALQWGNPVGYSAPLEFADNVVNEATGTLRFRGRMPNPTLLRPEAAAVVGVAPWAVAEFRGLRRLSPGMFVRVRMPVGDPYPAILVPEEAIGTEQDRKFVYVLTNPTDTGKTEERDEDRGSQKVKVAYAVWKGTPELRWVEPGAQLERPGKPGGPPVVHRVVGRTTPRAGDKPPPLAPTDSVILSGLQKVRRTKDEAGNVRFADVTWLVPKADAK